MLKSIAVALLGTLALRANAQQAPQPNTLSAAEQAAGWKLLFDGKSLANWRQYKADTVPTGWQVYDGAITKVLGGVPDLVTRSQFADFELAFEWKLSVGGNAGVFYRATEEYDRIYWSAPEMQLLDNIKGADNRTNLTRAGAAYMIRGAPDFHANPSVWDAPMDTSGGRARAKAIGPTELSEFLRSGEWNASRIVVKGPHVEHWLNGFKLLEYEFWSPEWEAIVAATKFKPYANYGRAKQGYVGLQGDHAGALALRNIKIRELK